MVIIVGTGNNLLLMVGKMKAIEHIIMVMKHNCIMVVKHNRIKVIK